MNKVEDIEKRMRTSIDQTNSDELMHEINHRQQMAADSGIIIEYATIIFNYVQGAAAEQMLLNTQAMEAPAIIRTQLMKGYLAKWDGMYERAIAATKKLDKSIDGLISMLSYNKALIASNIGSQNWQSNNP